MMMISAEQVDAHYECWWSVLSTDSVEKSSYKFTWVIKFRVKTLVNTEIFSFTRSGQVKVSIDFMEFYCPCYFLEKIFLPFSWSHRHAGHFFVRSWKKIKILQVSKSNKNFFFLHKMSKIEFSSNLENFKKKASRRFHNFIDDSNEGPIENEISA